MSELPLRSPGTRRSVPAKLIGADRPLASDQVVDLGPVSEPKVGLGTNRLTPRDEGAHGPHPGDDPLSARHRGVRKGGRITELSRERKNARARRDELHTGTVRP